MASSRRAAARRSAFTLLELLFVVLIISILALLILPALSKAQARARRASCVSQLRQIGVAMHEFSHDHLDQFPFQVPTNQGGTLEFARAGFAMSGEFFFAFRHFQALSDALVTPRMLRCPSDPRLAAASFSSLQNSNLSYFVGTTAEYSKPESILCGDRNIFGDGLASGSIVRISTNTPVAWTSELHGFKGNLLFADGHVATVNNGGLGAAVYASGTPIGYLLPPVTPPPGSDDSGPSLVAVLQQAFDSVPRDNRAAGPGPGDASVAGGGTRGVPVPVVVVPGRGAGTPGLPAPAPERPARATNLVAKPDAKPVAPVTAPASAPAAVVPPPAASGLYTFVVKPEEHLWSWLLLLLLAMLAAFLVGRQLHRRRRRQIRNGFKDSASVHARPAPERSSSRSSRSAAPGSAARGG